MWNLKKLIEAGADVNFANNNGEIPLHRAALKGAFLFQTTSFYPSKG